MKAGTVPSSGGAAVSPKTYIFPSVTTRENMISRHSAFLRYVLIESPGTLVCSRSVSIRHLSLFFFKGYCFGQEQLETPCSTCRNAAERASFQSGFPYLMQDLTIDHPPASDSHAASPLTMSCCSKKPSVGAGSYSKDNTTYCELYALTMLSKPHASLQAKRTRKTISVK